MCHSRGRGLLFAILAAMSMLDCLPAGAQTGSIEQNFAAFLTAVPSPAVEALMVGSVGAGHYAFISQGRPSRIIRN